MKDMLNESTADTPSLRWNDIRIVGPLLVAVLLAAAMLTPHFGSTSGSQSVGSSFTRCAEAQPALVGVSLDSCDDMPAPPPVITTVPTVSAVPMTTPPPAPVVIDTPDPIMGPIWLGATQGKVVEASVVLQTPRLLASFIEDNVVTVTDDDDMVVFEGPLSDGAITLYIWPPEGDYTMVTVLSTGAVYTEIISVAAEG